MRLRNYNDKDQFYDVQPPPNAPEWAYVTQPVEYETDIGDDFGYDSYETILDDYMNQMDEMIEEYQGSETSNRKGKEKVQVGIFLM